MVVVVIAVLLVVGATILAALAFDRYYADRVLPGVTVGGVNATGLTATELAASLEALPVGPRTIDVISGGRRVQRSS